MAHTIQKRFTKPQKSSSEASLFFENERIGKKIGVRKAVWTSRRERILISIFVATFIGYVIYLIGLQNSSLRLASEFKEYINLREHIDFLHTVGHIETGVLGAGLVASVFVYYRNGSLDRTLLTYTLVGILILSSVIVVGLNLYYRHIINLLGL